MGVSKCEVGVSNASVGGGVCVCECYVQACAKQSMEQSASESLRSC